MKSFNPVWLLVCSCFLQLHAIAQPAIPLQQKLPDKALLFSGLANKLSISNIYIERLFDSMASAFVRLPLTGGNVFEGIINERVEKSANLVTLNILLSNYAGALLTLSRIKNSSSFNYVGRIISIKHGDVLILTKEKDQYFFIKQKQSLYLVE